MNQEIAKYGGETPYIIKDMNEFFGKPKDIKELLDAIEKLPKEEFYDLHDLELRQTEFQLYMNLSRQNTDYSTNNDQIRYKLSRLFDLKENIEKSIARLGTAIKNYHTEYYNDGFLDNPDQFDTGSKIIFTKILDLLIQNKKKLKIEDVDSIVSSNCVGRLDVVNEIEFSIFAKIFAILLQNYIYNTNNKLDLALSNLLEIHGEDISRLLLGGGNIDNKTRNSILFTQYGYGYITINNLIDGLKYNLQKNKESINELVKPFLGIYNWLKVVIEHTNSDQNLPNKITTNKPPSKLPANIDTNQINDLYQENIYIQTILDTPKDELISKLQILKQALDIRGLFRSLE